MVKLFILVKRKGAKTALGAIPVRSGVSRAKAQSVLKKQLKPGFQAKIITDSQLRRLLISRVKRSTKRTLKRKVLKKRLRRKKRR